MTWTPCAAPAVGNVIRWREPVWAPPNKKRGKPDQIGEQMITAQVTALGDVVQLLVQEVEILSIDDGVETPAGVKEGDSIKRKATSLERGHCERQSA